MPSVGTSTQFSRLFLGGPLAFGVLCGGRDCSGHRRSIHLALQPWPSTVNFFTYSNRPMSVTGQQPLHWHRRSSTFGRSAYTPSRCEPQPPNQLLAENCCQKKVKKSQ
eukprot:scaffold121323_cov42-Cyclotella_meneghiniana.AAC.2